MNRDQETTDNDLTLGMKAKVNMILIVCFVVACILSLWPGTFLRETD